jgi:hypothetical protein
MSKFALKIHKNELTARAILIGAYGSADLPTAYEAAAVAGDVQFALERLAGAMSLETISAVKKNKFARKGHAEFFAQVAEKSRMYGWGVMIGGGTALIRTFDTIEVVRI